MSLKLSRRKRRVAATLLGFGLFAVVTMVVVQRVSDPGTGYVPGGEIDGLTTGLTRDLPPDHPAVSFADATEAAGITFQHFLAPRSGQLPEDMGSGAAWADYDNDGWLDLFLVDIAMQVHAGASQVDTVLQMTRRGSSRLYRNLGDGTFSDVTAKANIDHRAVGMGVSWADYDNDGWTDLFLTAFGDNVLFRNLGDGTFRDVTESSGMGDQPGFWAGASWGDYDVDGYLDLYVTGYVEYETLRDIGSVQLQYDIEIPASLNPSSFQPHRNLLWHNDGDGTFTDMAEAAGVVGDRGRGLGAVWADFDEDGWPDLYVANDVSDNVLYRNMGDGTFTDVSYQAAVADYRGAMGLALGDWDGDEDLDLFITHWIAQENALFSNLTADLTANPGEPSALRFFDEADRRGLGQIALDYIGWGTSFFDYDNDGQLDLFVTNGSTFQRDDQPDLLVPMRDLLFWNQGLENGFFDVSSVAGAYFSVENVGRGAAFGDYDRDGDLDIVVVNHGGSPTLLRNDGGDQRAWIEVRLEGVRGNRSAIGARIRLVSGENVQTRVVGAQASYLSHNSLNQHFGLGDSGRVDTLEVLWTNGDRQYWTDIPTRRAIRLIEDTDDWLEEWIAESRGATQAFWKHYRAAGRNRLAGLLQEAADAYESALTLDPGHEDALYYLGSVRLTMGEFEKSLEALERLVEINPESTRAYTQLGVLHACPDPGAPLDLHRAAEALGQAWALNREQTGTPLWLGLIALLQDDPSTAHEHFDSVLGSNPNSVPATYLSGYVNWTQGKTDDAKEALAAAVAHSNSVSATEVGLQEGDTRGMRPRFAGAMSCPWLEDQLAELGQSGPFEGVTIDGRYGALQTAIELARERVP